MSEHTPGPWYSSCMGGQYTVRQWPKNPKKPSIGKVIATQPERISPDRQQANAALIAAAPELLDALEDAESFAKAEAVAWRNPDAEDEAARMREANRLVTKFRNAIATARGEQ